MSESIEILRWNELDDTQRQVVLQRPESSQSPQIREQANSIVAAVRENGDSALRQLTRQYDGAAVEVFAVSSTSLKDAERALNQQQLNAIDVAIGNVGKFHESLLPKSVDVETSPGVRCERISQPLDSVGLYVPAGTAPLPSAAIMLAVPAVIAGCTKIVLCTPPRPDGSADSAVLAAAARSGITDVFCVGGAQAIAAMAYGTESIPKVRKIFGPGNAWVTAAKAIVSADPGGAAIDMPAGPSEVLVIADESARADFVAADLLSQAEHGVDSQVVLLTSSAELAVSVRKELTIQLAKLSRKSIASQSLMHSRLVLVANCETAMAISNDYAPEHLILQINDARAMLPRVRNAGSVFVGPWSPESAGDYCSGTNHVLPTYGYAASYSGLGVEQFMRHMTIQELTRDGLRGLAPAILSLAELEGLDAHAAAVRLRVDGANA